MSSDPTKTGIKYIGNDAPFVDNLYGSGLKFMPNQTRLVEHDLAAKLIRHAEFVEDVGFDYVTANTNLTGRMIFSGNGYGAIDPPAGFNFDFTKLGADLVIYKDYDGAVRWDYDYESLIPASAKAAPLARIIHVSPTGSDSNTGVGAYQGDFANAKASISSAITYANSLANGCQVIVAPGTYLRAKNWNGSTPTVPLWVRGWHRGNLGNRPVWAMCDDLTWALDGTYTNCYKATRSAMFRVVDLTVKDEFGNYVELTKQTTATACNTTPNSWYTDGTSVYVRRTDGAAPNINNTWALMNATSLTTGASSGDLYIDGINIFGGTATIKDAQTKKACFVDTEFRFQGGPSSVTNAISVLDYDLAVFVRCVATKASTDGFNAHAAAGKIPTMLTLDCVGFDNGDGIQSSCNGWTIHDGIQAIDVNGHYHSNQGANVIPVTALSGALCVGTVAEYGRVQPSATPPQNFTASTEASLWMDSTIGRYSDGDITAAGGAVVKVRNHKTLGCRVERSVNDTATISDY